MTPNWSDKEYTNPLYLQSGRLVLWEHLMVDILFLTNAVMVY